MPAADGDYATGRVRCRDPRHNVSGESDRIIEASISSTEQYASILHRFGPRSTQLEQCA
jgi:hypothetical protein